MHQLDQLDFEERDIARGNSNQTYPRGEMGKDLKSIIKAVLLILSYSLQFLGEPLRTTSIYASTTMVFGGREHKLPIIVVSCIEKLYRTGK
jgi:hypothetical protein